MTRYIARISLALIWFYHGLVPKILFRNEQEILMNDVFLPFLKQDAALLISGIAEIVYSILLVVFLHSKKVLLPSMLFSGVVTVALLLKLPSLFTNAFNPFSINLAVCSLSIISFLNVKENEKGRT